MVVKCKLPYYKYFFQERGERPPLTERQLAILSKATPERRFKYWGAVAKHVDDPTMDVLERYSRAKGESLRSKTRKGQSLTEIEKGTQQQLEKLKQKVGIETMQQAEQFVDSMAQQYRRGDILDEAQRELLYPVVAQKLDRLQPLMAELDAATAAGDSVTAAYKALELQQAAAAFAAVMGDKNAVAIAFNSYKRLNSVFKTGGKVDRLFQNGDCL